ncbi:hypothetical protein L6307_02035 [Candidatus Parcubacteria bacterium]|nr:hypothetical protein [Patescibacteria group bacterium]MCG2697856.1 hypothetical protein [Candidatus Parcubacteria bacterium]MCG2700626.1 hypothetical protein [Candidatus Parcubacteria bacterium]
MKKSHLKVRTREDKNGITIILDIISDQKFSIEYPKNIWQKTPSSIRQCLLENLSYANTHFLPLILKTGGVSYETALPFLESFFFRNQLYDLHYCEKADGAESLSYLKHFYNLEFQFASIQSALPNNAEISEFDIKKKKAIIPFSFGKESLLVVGICMELGIEPILVYCQEPSQRYEEKFKRKRLKELSEDLGITTYFLKNDPGLFRHAAAFGEWNNTEIGWGTQTTILNLLMIPFAFAHEAAFIFFGNEFSNNSYDTWEEWNRFPSFDQTSFWTQQQNIITQLLTNKNTHTYALLESMEEINTQSALYHRYPKLSKYHSSCFGLSSFKEKTAWCGNCYKCEKMFIIGAAMGYSFREMGFSRDLFKKEKILDEYFSGYQDIDSDCAFYIMKEKGIKNSIIDLFEKEKIGKIHDFLWYKNYFSKLKPASNLPPDFSEKIIAIEQEEIDYFLKKTLCSVIK